MEKQVKIKTPLEVLHKYFHHFKSERTRSLVIKAMEDYAEQFIKQDKSDDIVELEHKSANWRKDNL